MGKDTFINSTGNESFINNTGRESSLDSSPDPRKPNRLVRDVMQAMEAIAPALLADTWDRVGLQLGDPASPVESVLIALDLTPDVLLEARNRRADLIICHHPVIFTPILTIRRDDPLQNLLIDAIQARISVFVAHTNLDASSGGVADAWSAHLCQALGVADAAAAGSNAKTDLPKITPYGRLIVLNQERPLHAVLSAVADSLPGSSLQLNISPDRAVVKIIRRIAAFPGSFPVEACTDLTQADVDLVICGECKYHDGLSLALAGITVTSVGHDRSELPALAGLAAILAEMLPQIQFAVYPGMDYNKQAN